MSLVAVANNSQLRLMSDTETVIVNTDASPAVIEQLVKIINHAQTLSAMADAWTKNEIERDL